MNESDLARHFGVYRLLWTMRMQFRAKRLFARITRPRTAVSSLLAVSFVIAYVFAGLTVLSRREPADPERLRLWLSGGMIIYALYHVVKQLWSNSSAIDSLPAAKELWLGGGPISRSSLVLREAANAIPATIAKSMLLAVVLWRDTPSLIFLLLGVSVALLMLEWIRRIVTAVIMSLSTRERRWVRGLSLFVGGMIVLQLGVGVWNHTPDGSDPVEYMLGVMSEVALFAASPPVQALALPLQPASYLAVGQPLIAGLPDVYALVILWGQFLSSLAILFFVAKLLIAADRWSIERSLTWEREGLNQLCSKVVNQRQGSALTMDAGGLGARWTSSPYGSIVMRQLCCIRRYWPNVVASFAIPMALSLSPLLTDQTSKQWIFVLGGIALSSLLLAPPALQIDFRRDLKRMPLLRSFPLSPWTVGLGMLSVPVAVTIAFQWSTLAIGAWLVGVSSGAVIWLAIAFPALAVLTFAVENALFLAFPHHVHAQGIAMVIRAKVTFIWKGVVLALFPVALIMWSTVCREWVSPEYCVLVAFLGSIVGIWTIALASVATMVRLWDRFDPAHDIPLE